MKSIKITLFAICGMFLAACTEHVVIGDNGILPETDAGQDAAQDQQADTNVQPDVQSDVQPDAPAPTVTIQIDPTLQAVPVNYKERLEEMLRLTLVGDENVDSTVTRLKFTRHGVGSNSDIKTLFVGGQKYDGLSQQQPTLDPASGTAEFTDLAIAVPAKAQVMVRLIVKLDGAVGAQHSFAVEASSDVGVQVPAQAAGEFPVQGPTFMLGTGWEPELAYGFEGPSSPPDAHAGAQSVTLFEFSATALNRRMHINNINLFLTSHDGGLARGTSGTFCWDNFRVLDQNDQVVSQVAKLADSSVANGAAGAYFGIQPNTDPLQPGVVEKFRVVADATSSEDAAGECFGHAYDLTFKLPGFATDVIDFDYADPLDPGQIAPQSDMQGNAIKLVKP